MHFGSVEKNSAFGASMQFCTVFCFTDLCPFFCKDFLYRYLNRFFTDFTSLCLLERLAFLGPGVRAAVQRRQLAEQLLERRRQDEEAYRQALASRGLRRVGRAFVE